jgi:hypothetical protein
LAIQRSPQRRRVNRCRPLVAVVFGVLNARTRYKVGIDGQPQPHTFCARFLCCAPLPAQTCSDPGPKTRGAASRVGCVRDSRGSSACTSAQSCYRPIRRYK